jgi:hypothetical protein
MAKYILGLVIGTIIYAMSLKYDIIDMAVFGYVGIKIVEWLNKPSDDWWNNVV